jgi:hypothetical protein
MPLRSRLSEIRSRLRESIDEARANALAVVTPSKPPVVAGEEPPVVARLMVEIRSDGTRTIARGALEDVENGERVAVEAQGATPAELAASLAKTLFTAPLLARTAFRAMLDAKRKR